MTLDDNTIVTPPAELTPTPPVVADEEIVLPVGEDNGAGEPVEGEVVTEPNVVEPPSTQPQLSVEELQTKVKEYEVREEEQRLLRERLNIPEEVDDTSFDLMTIDGQIVNKGKVAYFNLCNEYGINADPNSVAKSLEDLKQKDPAKGYEFERRIELLNRDVTAQRSQVTEQQYQYSVGKFVEQHKDIIQSSPVIHGLVSDYVQGNYGKSENIYGELNELISIASAVMREGIEIGQKYALQSKAKSDTSGVEGGLATAITSTHTSGKIFTRGEIDRMSLAEYTKYEPQIKEQASKGLIK